MPCSASACLGVPWTLSALECLGLPWGALECRVVPCRALECLGVLECLEVPWSALDCLGLLAFMTSCILNTKGCADILSACKGSRRCLWQGLHVHVCCWPVWWLCRCGRVRPLAFVSLPFPLRFDYLCVFFSCSDGLPWTGHHRFAKEPGVAHNTVNAFFARASIALFGLQSWMKKCSMLVLPSVLTGLVP